MQTYEYEALEPAVTSRRILKRKLLAALGVVAVVAVVAIVVSLEVSRSRANDSTPSSVGKDALDTSSAGCVGCDCFIGTGNWTTLPKQLRVWHPAHPGPNRLALSGPKPTKPTCQQHFAAVDPSTLPASFDAREQWPGWMQPVQDEGECGSAWSNALPVAASDRLAIATKGATVELLAPAYLLLCDAASQPPCDHDGNMYSSYSMLTSAPGVPSSTCIPWSTPHNGCPTHCADGTPVANAPLYHGKSYQNIAGEGAMMKSIMDYGPITTVMTLHMPAFNCYQSGIYTNGDLPVDDFHVAVIVGWGEEAGVKYWIIQNSFGTQWGEQGYVRIGRGEDDCNVEFGMWGYCSIATEM